MLHFEKFCEAENIEIGDNFVEFIAKIQVEKVSADDFENTELSMILDKYFKYKNDTLNGNHRKTAQFHMTYVELVNYYPQHFLAVYALRISSCSDSLYPVSYTHLMEVKMYVGLQREA